MADLQKIQESKERYIKEKVDQFKVYFPKGEREIVKEYAKSQGKSLNAYILDLIHADMESKK